MSINTDERPLDLQNPPKRRLRVCGLCGAERPKTAPFTKDHVIPAGWFNDPPPPNLPTWRACRRCNGGLEESEDRLRSTFANAHSHHPEHLERLLETVRKSRRAPRGIRNELVRTPEGIFVSAPVSRVEQRDLDVVFRKIARGLFWYRNHRLPGADTWTVRKLTAEGFGRQSEIYGPFAEGGVQKLGPHCWWMTVLFEDDPDSAVWLFLLFGAVAVGVWMGGAGRFAPPPDDRVTLR